MSRIGKKEKIDIENMVRSAREIAILLKKEIETIESKLWEIADNGNWIAPQSEHDPLESEVMFLSSFIPRISWKVSGFPSDIFPNEEVYERLIDIEEDEKGKNILVSL